MSHLVDKKKIIIIYDCSILVVFVGNNTNRSKLHAQREKEQTKFGECFLPFSSESFIIPSAVQKCKRVYKTIILPVVLYGCETWSLTLREEHRLRVFENRVLRRIFGPKGDEVTGE
jgi:hypothetical protein